MATCVVPSQIDKDVCKAVFGKVYSIGFLDTSLAGFTYPAVTEVTTRVGIEALVDSESMYSIRALSAENVSAEIVTEEIAGQQVFVANGESRIKVRCLCNYETWNALEGYDYFTGKEAYLFSKDNKVTYINDGETVPSAYGLPLGMVAVENPPLFSDGATSAEFYMYVNIDSELLTGIERGILEFPISTLDPVASA